MVRDTRGRGLALVLALLLVGLGVSPALAQTTGGLKGKVIDVQGQPVDGAKILIEFLDLNRKNEVKSNKKGEFVQVGLQPGNYRVTASKDGVGSQTLDVRVRLGNPGELNFTLVSGAMSGMSREEAQKYDTFKKLFEAGVAASGAGDYDGAIAKFTEAQGAIPDCYACEFNIGGAYYQKKEYDKAEEWFKKAMARKPDSAEAYNALANLYNTQKKFDLAAQMTEEATKRQNVLGSGGSGTNADSLFNQGVIFWNAGKIADAKKQFEEALKVKPDLADAHYWVGMASLNEGKIPEAIQHFEEYAKLAPDGQYANDVKNALAALKK